LREGVRGRGKFTLTLILSLRGRGELGWVIPLLGIGILYEVVWKMIAN
jgi:hypothetical protein